VELTENFVVIPVVCWLVGWEEGRGFRKNVSTCFLYFFSALVVTVPGAHPTQSHHESNLTLTIAPAVPQLVIYVVELIVTHPLSNSLLGAR